LQTSIEFKQGVLKGIAEGAAAASAEFFPSLAHSVYGLGRILWDGAKALSHPVETTINFINACEQMGAVTKEYYQTIAWDKVQEQLESEFQNFCRNYDSLSDAERGHLMGYVVGK
jgi:hypothetical protein